MRKAAVFGVVIVAIPAIMLAVASRQSAPSLETNEAAMTPPAPAAVSTDTTTPDSAKSAPDSANSAPESPARPAPRAVVDTTPKQSAQSAPSAASASSSAASASPATISTYSGVFTNEQAKAGETIYMVLCNSCHAPLNNHVGPIFKASWGGATAADMMDYLVAEMPKNDPGSLSRSEYASIMAYLFKLNGMPAGNTALATDAASLRKIRIDTVAR